MPEDAGPGFHLWLRCSHSRDWRELLASPVDDEVRLAMMLMHMPTYADNAQADFLEAAQFLIRAQVMKG